MPHSHTPRLETTTYRQYKYWFRAGIDPASHRAESHSFNDSVTMPSMWCMPKCNGKFDSVRHKDNNII